MSPTANTQCRHCEHENPPGSRFCNQCGGALERVAEPGAYTPRHLSEKILHSRSAMEGERKQVTVLFVDVKDSVALSRQVDAEQWHAILDRFFALLGEKIHSYEGTINQYTGDGVMALFGAPIAHEDHAGRACHAALAIRDALERQSRVWEQEYGIKVQCRQGLNSGEVIVGRIGDDLRMDYTAKGQTVGLAARLEQLAKADTILISAYTHDLVASEFSCKQRGSVAVKGFEHKIETFELRQVAESAKEDETILPLIGRERELGLLEAYRSQVEIQETGLFVGVSADTGLGKSRLCHEFIRRCRERDVPVVHVHGSSHYLADPLSAIRELFFSYFQLDSEEEPEVIRGRVDHALQAFMPVPPILVENLYVILGLADYPDDLREEPNLRAEMAQNLIIRLLHEGLLQQHQVLVIENVQWFADEKAHTLLKSLLLLLPHLPVLVVVTARRDYDFAWASGKQMRSLPLNVLSEEQSQNLLSHLIGDGKELVDLRHLIVERSGGNPMFIQELVEHLYSSGVLEAGARGPKLKQSLTELSLPPSVQAVVAARIDTLPDHAKRLLQGAAVINGRVSEALLQDVFANKAQFSEALAELLDKGFLQRQTGVDGQPALVFVQSIFQVVCYEALLTEQRQDWHRQVAHALLRSSKQDVVLIAQRARHHAEAGEYSEAVSAYLQSAEMSAYTDLSEALKRLNKARGIVDSSLANEPGLSLRVLSRWLQFSARAGLPEPWTEILQQAEALSKRPEVDLEDRFLFAISRGTVELASAHASAALQEFRAASDLLDENSASELQSQLSAPLAIGLLATGHLVEAQQAIERGLLQCAEDAQVDSRLLSYSPKIALLTLKSWLGLQLAQADTALAWGEQAYTAALSSGHGEQIVAAESIWAFALAETENTSQALEHAEQALQLGRSMKHPVGELFGHQAYARALIRAERPIEAIVVLEDALRHSGDIGFGLGEHARLQADLSLAQLLAGNAREARNIAAAAVKGATDVNSELAMLEAYLAYSRAGLFSSRPTVFLKRYQMALERSEKILQNCDARLHKPEQLYLQSRYWRLKEQQDKADALLEQAVQLRKNQGFGPCLSALVAHSQRDE